MTIMKKIYQMPLTQVVNIETQKFIAGSKFDGQEVNDSFNITPTDEEYNGEGASRYYDDWD